MRLEVAPSYWGWEATQLLTMPFTVVEGKRERVNVELLYALDTGFLVI